MFLGVLVTEFTGDDVALLVGNDRDDNSVAVDGGGKCLLPLFRLSGKQPIFADVQFANLSERQLAFPCFRKTFSTLAVCSPFLVLEMSWRIALASGAEAARSRGRLRSLIFGFGGVRLGRGMVLVLLRSVEVGLVRDFMMLSPMVVSGQVVSIEPRRN